MSVTNNQNIYSDPDGWTDASDVGEYSSPTNDEEHEPGKRSVESNSNAPENMSDIEGQNLLARNIPFSLLEPENLKNALIRFLGGWSDAGLRKSKSSDGVFQNLCQHISDSTALTEWYASRKSGSFFLNIPGNIDIYCFTSSLVKCLTPKTPSSKYSTVPITSTRTPQSYSERLLAELCYQAMDSIDGVQPSFFDDLSTALKGYNQEWKENMLWLLLQAILSSGSNKRQIFVLAINTLEAKDPCHSVLEKIGDFCRATERTIKILVIAGLNQSSSFNAHGSMTVNTENENIRKAIVSDLEMAVKCVRMLSRRVSNSDELDLLLSSRLDQFVEQPMLAMCYIRSLTFRSWLTRTQISNELNLLTSPDHFVDNILERIPNCDRPLVADILGFLAVSFKTLSRIELEMAVSMARNGRVDDTLLDVEFDLDQSLAGLFYIEDGCIRVSQPCFAYVNNFDAKKTSWLHSGPVSHQKMADLCLQYIILFSAAREGRAISVQDIPILDQAWPLLDYAATFWQKHYEWSDQSMIAKDHVKERIEQTPSILHSWLLLQDAFNPGGLHISENQTPDTQHDASMAAELANRFGSTFSLTICYMALAKRIASVIDGDETTAIIWSAWVLCPDFTDAPAWLERTRSIPKPQSLLKALPYAARKTYSLLKAVVDLEFIHQNAKYILQLVAKQDIGLVDSDCLQWTTLDSNTIYDLPLESCVRGGSELTLSKVLDHWPSPTDTGRSFPGDNLVYEAVRHRKVNVLNKLLHRLTDCGIGRIVVTSESFMSTNNVLHLATKTGYRDMVQNLLQLAPDLVRYYYNEVRETSLSCACSNGYIDITAALLHEGFEEEEKPPGTDTILHMTVRTGYLELVRLVLEASGNAEKKDAMTAAMSNWRDPENYAHSIYDYMFPEGLTPLEVAIKYGHKDITEFLMQNTPAMVVSERLLLHVAVYYEKHETLKLALSSPDVDVNKKGTQFNEPAIHIACRRGFTSLAMELLQNGADASVADEYEIVPLIELKRCSESEPRLQIAKLLLGLGNPTAPEILNEALVVFAENGFDDLVNLVLDAGANKNYKNSSNRTALHSTAYNGKEDVLRTLLLRRVDLYPLDQYGDTPLKDATNGGYMQIVKILLDAGALKKDSESPTYSVDFMLWASQRGKDAVVEMLLERGERFPLEGDRCPLEKVTENNHVSMLRIILKHQPEFQGTVLLSECAYSAFFKQNVEILRVMLDNNADPNVTASRGYFGNVLNACAVYSNVRMARVLLEHPVYGSSLSVNMLAGPYHTPLISAVSKRYNRDERRAEERLRRQKFMVQFLLQQEADLRLFGGNRGTMLNAAVASGSPDLVSYVLSLGFNITDVDAEKRGATHFACITGPYALENLKLAASMPGGQAMLWETDAHGRMPLHFACGNGRLTVLNNLLGQKESPLVINQPDHDGWTPLHWACRDGSVNIINRLRIVGADSNKETANPFVKHGSTDTDLWTPWDVAVYHGNSTDDILETLKPARKEAKSRKQFRHAATCDSCYVTTWGTRYKCEQYNQYDLCSKCYEKARTLRDREQTFEVIEYDPKDV